MMLQAPFIESEISANGIILEIRLVNGQALLGGITVLHLGYILGGNSMSDKAYSRHRYRGRRFFVESRPKAGGLSPNGNL